MRILERRLPKGEALRNTLLAPVESQRKPPRVEPAPRSRRLGTLLRLFGQGRRLGSCRARTWDGAPQDPRPQRRRTAFDVGRDGGALASVLKGQRAAPLRGKDLQLSPSRRGGRKCSP